MIFACDLCGDESSLLGVNEEVEVWKNEGMREGRYSIETMCYT